jgi:hypothetical protein
LWLGLAAPAFDQLANSKWHRFTVDLTHRTGRTLLPSGQGTATISPVPFPHIHIMGRGSEKSPFRVRITRLSDRPAQSVTTTAALETAWHRSTLKTISRRRILYWLLVMVAVLVVGTVIGFIWADTSNVAGSIAVASNIIGPIGIVVLLVALGITTRRRSSNTPHAT